jgi:hypothetical protein
MEVTAKRKGNPNFGRKQTTEFESDTMVAELTEPQATKELTIDPKKVYHFQLTKTYEKLKPIDSKSGNKIESLYPPYYLCPNEGVALDEDGEMKRWRFLYGYPSIWVDEQLNPEPTDEQIRDSRNDIIFEEGNLFIRGTERAKIKALLIQDLCEDQTNKMFPVNSIFRLIKDGESLNKATQVNDKAFEAESAARNASIEELLPIAMLFGINVDGHEKRGDYIKKEVILKARQLPDAFLANFVSPKTNIKYLITKALNKNIISGHTGTLTMVETDRALFPIDKNADIAEQVSTLVMANDEQASLLYTQLKKVLS